MRVCAVEFSTGNILAMCKVSDLGLVQSFSFWIGSHLPPACWSFCVFLDKHSCTIPGMFHLSLAWTLPFLSTSQTNNVATHQKPLPKGCGRSLGRRRCIQDGRSLGRRRYSQSAPQPQALGSAGSIEEFPWCLWDAGLLLGIATV